MTTSQKLDHQLTRLQESIERRESAKVYQFPLWGDPQRGVPNDQWRTDLSNLGVLPVRWAKLH